jgi:hypothetical protein
MHFRAHLSTIVDKLSAADIFCEKEKIAEM